MLSIVEGFPRLFGRYALLTSFGRGGMGEVFLAKQRVGETARLCVVKTLRGDLADSREYIGRFKDEAHVVVQLNHAHISQVYEYGVTGVDHFLVMEFIHGVNLREFLQDQQKSGGALDAGLALFVVSTTLDALAYAHRLRSPTTGEQLRVVHRDVSPANVMVGFEGDVKLIDFGLAESSLKQEQTETRAVMGKVGYMSPEQARGDDVDGTCDQFAAAVMLYEAVSGDRFYGDWNTHQIWQKVGFGGHVPRRWSSVPEPLRPILSRALDADPRRRYPDCDAFRDDLDELRARLAPRANKTMLRETLRRLYAPRIDAEQQLIAGFAHVLPPVEGAVPPPSSSQSISAPRAAAQAPATEPFLTSPSQPAGLAVHPGRPPGAGPEAFSSSVPPTSMPPPQVPPASVVVAPRLSMAAPASSLSDSSSSSPFEPTMSSRAVTTAGAVTNPAGRNLVIAAALGVAAVVGGVWIARSGGGDVVVDAGLVDAVVVDAGAADAGFVADAGLFVADAGAADAGPLVADAGAVDVGTVDAGTVGAEVVVSDAGAVEVKPAATRPVETKPDDTKPVETKPVETKPIETKPVETKRARASLSTSELLQEVDACTAIPANVRAMLRSGTNAAAQRTIALKQLDAYCPR